MPTYIIDVYTWMSHNFLSFNNLKSRAVSNKFQIREGKNIIVNQPEISKGKLPDKHIVNKE